MNLIIAERLSDSPFVERIWRTQSEKGGFFTSIALSHWELVVWRQFGKINLTMRGPETKATTAPVPEDAEFFGIIFKHGAFMPHLPIGALVDNQVSLPEATNQSFWLNSSTWELPNFENADTFVQRLVRAGVLAREPVVDAVLRGQSADMSLRSMQRRLVRATGLTHTAIRQIERARRATILLKEGVSILDTVHQLGYADQSHLTRALKHLIGRTPSQLVDSRNSDQLSFLFKTTPP